MSDIVGTLLLYLLAASGLTLIVTRSILFLPVRMRFKDTPLVHALVQCPRCAGAWYGIFFGLICAPDLGQVVMFGFVVSGWPLLLVTAVLLGLGTSLVSATVDKLGREKEDS